MPPNRHDWLSWDQYQAAHYGNLERFPHFIVEIDLQPIVTKTTVYWDGRLHCVDGWEICVTKRQVVRRRRGRQEVRTVSYAYQVNLHREHGSVREVLRYDNSAHHDHEDAHHRHDFDAAGAERVVHVGEAGWPTLGDVIAEVEQIWAGNLFA